MLTTETIARLRGMLETGKAHESQLFACSAADAESLLDAAEQLAAVQDENARLQAIIADSPSFQLSRRQYEELADEGESLREQLAAVQAELAEARRRLLTAAGDDLCRLTQEEIKAMTAGEVPIPPKEEFLPSCERFWEQTAARAGVNHGCMTLAQFVAENERLRAERNGFRGALERISRVCDWRELMRLLGCEKGATTNGE